MKSIVILLSASILSLTNLYSMSAVEKATNMHLRIAGVEPTPEVRAIMVNHINAGNELLAAQEATKNRNFINLTVKAMAKDWLEKDDSGNLRGPLNDFVATIAGFIRDDIPFNQILSADVVYTVQGVGTGYALNNNDHYRNAEQNNIDLADNLMRQVQSDLNPELGPGNTAGVMTTRGFSEIYISAGTNRRAGFQFPAVHIFCKGLEGVMGKGTFGKYIRTDVDRFPAGDHNTFINECQLCHETNDAVTQAFNTYDWDDEDGDGKLVYLPTAQRNSVDRLRHPSNRNVAGKTDKFNFEENVNFPEGFKPAAATDVNGQPLLDTWFNAWATGDATKGFGFYGPSTGRGPKSYGLTLTMNNQFPLCMVSHAFKKTCYHKPTSSSEIAFVESLAADFSNPNKYNFNMKRVFEETGTFCANSN